MGSEQSRKLTYLGEFDKSYRDLTDIVWIWRRDKLVNPDLLDKISALLQHLKYQADNLPDRKSP